MGRQFDSGTERSTRLSDAKFTMAHRVAGPQQKSENGWDRETLRASQGGLARTLREGGSQFDAETRSCRGKRGEVKTSQNLRAQRQRRFTGWRDEGVFERETPRT